MVQALPHDERGCAQAIAPFAHTPALQVTPTAQARPQPPQFSASAFGSAQYQLPSLFWQTIGLVGSHEGGGPLAPPSGPVPVPPDEPPSTLPTGPL